MSHLYTSFTVKYPTPTYQGLKGDERFEMKPVSHSSTFLTLKIHKCVVEYEKIYFLKTTQNYIILNEQVGDRYSTEYHSNTV